MKKLDDEQISAIKASCIIFSIALFVIFITFGAIFFIEHKYGKNNKISKSAPLLNNSIRY
jgi:uncharacterized membrane protein affecting hemolysin expression